MGCWGSFFCVLQTLSSAKACAAAAILGCAIASPCLGQERFKFDLGGASEAPGYISVSPAVEYSKERGYGFEPGGTLSVVGENSSNPLHDGVTSTALFKFSVAIPEGNYRVTVLLGSDGEPGVTTVKTEARRLMLETVRTAAGEFVGKSFLVSIRSPKIAGGGEVMLDTYFENTPQGLIAHWDDKLTLQFSDQHPVVCGIEIEPAQNVTTVFLMGDSTVTDQAREPNGTWGMYLPRWFNDQVVVANYAESGETLKAFRRENRWAKIMSQVKPGDYIFMQFGHNDLNKTGHNAVWPGPEGEWSTTHSPAETDYKMHLKEYVEEARAKGAIPVIVSPMTKLNLRTGEVNIAGMQEYPRCAVEAAKECGAACIDLNAMSIELCQALGTDGAKLAYVDGLHSNSYGGYLFSRCIAKGIQQAGLDLAKQLLPEAGEFDPANPQPKPDAFTLPLEPRPPGRGRRGRGGVDNAPPARDGARAN